MPNKKLIRHYQWQVRRLNGKINENPTAKYIFSSGVSDLLKIKLPCAMPMQWVTHEIEKYEGAGSDVDPDLCLLKFWFNARNVFLNRIAALSGY